MQSKTIHNDSRQKFLDHFLCAGSSALILSIANVYPQCWFISLFALIPFLWRAIKVNLADSVILGIILASCYTVVTYPGEILITPFTFCFRFFILNLIFVVFGTAVNLLKSCIGIGTIFTAVLWLPLEYILIHYAGLGNIFVFENRGSGFVVRLASLFGILVVSFGIVLINSLILMFIEHIGRRVFSKGKIRFAKEKQLYPQFGNIIAFKRWYHFLDPRAPPSTACYC